MGRKCGDASDRVQSFSYVSQIRSGDLMYNAVTTGNNTVPHA